MKPSEALAELKAAINLFHFVSGPAKATLQEILDRKYDPSEPPVRTASKPADKPAAEK